jgi:membrane associated rhomboid family serine protease
MFLPIGDTPQPPRGWVPWVTWLLIAVNVLIYAVLTLPLSFKLADPYDPLLPALIERVGAHGAGLLTGWDLFVERWAYIPARGSLVTLFVAMFLHANFAHLAGNMLFLGIFGDNVEHRLGRLGFLATYLGTGAFATLAYTAVSPDPGTPMLGASGAISGALGAYFLMFPQNKVRVLVWLIWLDVWLVPAPIVLGAYVILDNLLPFLLDRTAGGVAYGAHLGGFFGGLVVAWVAERWLHRGRPEEAPADPEAARYLARADWLARHGQTGAAFQYYLAVLQRTDDPVLVAGARRGLRELPLDPRLRDRLGL